MLIHARRGVLVWLCAVGRVVGQPCVPHWTDEFAAPGLDSSASRGVMFDDGRGLALYACGDFMHAGSLAAGMLARWDGTSWSAIAGPDRSWARDMAVWDDGHGPAIFMATELGPKRYDGHAFVELDPSFVAERVTVHDGGTGAVFAGWAPNSAGQYVPCVRAWTGSGWVQLGGEFTRTGGSAAIFSLASIDLGDGPHLYVGGWFTAAGGVAAADIARWNGSSWEALGAGLPSSGGPGVLALAAQTEGSQSSLIAGGMFTVNGGTTLHRAARYANGSWDGSFADPPGSTLGGLQTVGTKVIAAGSFPWSGSSYGLAVLEQRTWTPFGPAFDDPGSCRAMVVVDGGIAHDYFMLGQFESVGGVQAANISRVQDGVCHSLGTGRGIGGEVYALKVFDDGSGSALYAGGTFHFAGGVPALNMARWNGTTWLSVGDGLPGSVAALASFDDGAGRRLYAAGRFFKPPEASCLARLDGDHWSLIPGLDPSIDGATCLAEFTDETGAALYIGLEQSIVRLDGQGISTSLDFSWDHIRALAVYDDGTGPDLYVGGTLYTLDGFGLHSTLIQRRSGGQWPAVAGQPADANGSTTALYAGFAPGTSTPALYVAGAFSSASAPGFASLVYLSQNSWHSMNAGLVAPDIRSLAEFDDGRGRTLNAAGAFQIPSGDVYPSNAARWDGAAWSALGTGIGLLYIQDYSMCVTAHDDGRGPSLFFGGRFATAGDLSAGHIARWTSCVGTCYANCDASTTPPLLNANDFQCFLNIFAAGDAAANCDGSISAPVLNANDFQCFLNAFAAGCI